MLMQSFPLEQPMSIFLLVTLVILLAPTLLSRLKIPNIVAMIACGMLLGPHAFNILARDASFTIFGQVGILYLMFLAAVEIDMVNLRKQAGKGIFFGLVTFCLPMLVGVPAMHCLFSLSWISSLLISAMFASHTLITYPIIAKFGLSHSRAVVISVCATVVAVLLTLIVLAEVVVVKITGGWSWSNMGALIVLTLAYVAAIGLAYPYLTRWFFRKYNEPVTQFVYVLALVLLASQLAQLIGLEAIIGAFYAGLVLNRFIPAKSPLMGRIEFAGNAIFIPYFLIGVGMLMDIRVLFSSWDVLLTALTMSVIALGTKWIAAVVCRKALSLTPTDGMIMFGLTSGKAAATIAATMIGFQYGLIDEQMMNAAVIMILMCCIVASVVTERSSLKLRMALTSADLKEETSRNDRVDARQLIAVANPVTAAEIMNLAILMRHPSNQNAVTTLFVRDSDDGKRLNMGREALRVAHRTAAAVDIGVEEVERYDTNIVLGMVNVLKERNCTDLIIGMHHRSNIVDTLFGSTIEQLVSSCNSMITISRCFTSPDTMARMVVIVPEKAEYETGFRRWVERVGNLATQLSCRCVFITFAETMRYIRAVLQADGYRLRMDFRRMTSWDDFINYSSEIEDEDLLIIVGARRTSISFSTDLENLPTYLSRYYASQNLLMIYPEQFGDTDTASLPIDVLQQHISTNPSPWMLSLKYVREVIAAAKNLNR